MNSTMTFVLLLVGAVVLYEVLLKPKSSNTASGNFTLGATVSGNANGVVV